MTDGFLNFNTKLDLKGFTSGLKNVGAGLDRIKGVLGSVASVAGIAFSTAGLISFAKASQEAYKVQLEAETKLETILGRNLGATEEQIKATKEWANALQKVGVIGDEIQLSGLQELSTYIENADSLKTMNEVLNDMLAQQYGLNATAESAVTISTMLGKVLEGQTSALSRYGYSFTEAQEQLLKYGTEEQRVATLADVVRASVGGVNEALVQTPAGRIKQLSNAFGDVKERIGEAFTNLEYMLLPALEHLVSMLAKAADYAVKLTETLAATFGIELHNTTAVTGAISDSIEEQEALTDAVEDTAKAQDNYLAGFDKITKLGDETTEKNTKQEVETVAAEIDDAPLVKSAEKAADKVREIFQGLLDVLAPLQAAWEKYGDSIEEHLSNNFNNIGSHIKNMFDATIQWAANLNWEPLLNSFDGLLHALEPITEDIGAGLEWLWVNVLLPLGKWTIEEAAPASLDVLSGALDVLDAAVDAVKPGLEEFWNDVLKPLLDKAGEITIEGLEKLSNWLHDLADWIREHPNISGFMIELAAAIGILYAAISSGAVSSAAKFITALAAIDVTALVVIAGIVALIYTITELSDNWEDICDVFEESGGTWEFLTGWIEYASQDIEDFFNSTEAGKKWLKFWEGVGEAIYNGVHWWGDTFEGFGERIWDISYKLGKFLGSWFKQAYSDVIKPFKPMAAWFLARWNEIKDIYNAASPYFKKKFDEAAGNIRNAFSNIGAFFSDLADRVKAPFMSIANWFKETFSEAWQNVLNTFSHGGTVFEGIKSGIDTVFKQTVNSLIGGINNTLRGPFETVNTAINALKGWELWTPWGDFYPFNWLPNISIPEIPRLAQGTAVPANYGEFLAVLGDNKREPEVVSPLSTIKKAVTEAMKEMGSSGGDTNINLEVDLDGKQIYRRVVRLNNESIRMTGRNPLHPEVVK